VRADVVIVDGLLAQPPAADEGIDGADGSISAAEEGLSVDLAKEPVSDLDSRIGPDHLQVEHRATGANRFDQMAQDVHDVLGLDSSE
jgi:hypothetical protein